MSEKIEKQDDFREMERRDELQILEELKGNIVEEMFYQFPSGGKMVTGISWVGIKEIAREYKNIDMKLEQTQDVGDAWLVVVKATDTKTGYSMLGASTQLKLMEVHDLDASKRWVKNDDGSYKMHKEADSFVLPKAFSKAQRNAIRALIPEKFLIEMYKKFKDMKGKTPPPRQGDATNSPKKVDAEYIVKNVESAPTLEQRETAKNPKKVDSASTITESLEPKAESPNISGFQPAANAPQMPRDFRLDEGAAWIAEQVASEFSQPLETVYAMIYQEIVKGAGLISQEAAATLVQKQFAENSTPSEEEWSRDNVVDLLGDDADRVDITEDGHTVKPKKFLADLWGPINEKLRSKGFQWIRDAKESRWELK